MKFNLKDHLFKDRAGEEPGKKAEITTTLLIGIAVAIFWAFLYQNIQIKISAIITAIIAGYSIVQVTQGKRGYPVVTSLAFFVTIVNISILEGKGLHDLIWAAALGVFMLANIYNIGSTRSIFIIGFVMLGIFIGMGVLEINNILPNPYETDVKYLFINASILFGIMGAMLTVFHNHRRLLVTSIEKENTQRSLSEQIEMANHALEEQVQSRTEELRNVNESLMAKNAALLAASEISKELIEYIHGNTDEILTRTAKLISQKFGYYHVGIFTIDSDRGFAVLRAANSKGGQEMLAKRHQLKVGGAGVVGYVSQSGRYRIALDTGVDAVYFNNPYLRETRSELSLPIKYSNNTIGVLDVQSTQPAAFTDDDVTNLTTIANQLALILYTQGDTSASNPAQRGERRSARSFIAGTQTGYSFRPDSGITAINTSSITPILNKVISSGETMSIPVSTSDGVPVLAVPVKFREQIIGVIQIEAAETNRNWTEDEIGLVQSISDRAALALENARLFEDATRRAEQEETISAITTKIGSSTDFERIMQTTIQELGLALGASRTFIQIGTSSATDEEENQ